MPSLQRAIAPDGLLFSTVADAAGRGAGTTVVRAADVDFEAPHVALTRLYHFEQSVVVNVVLLVVFTALEAAPAGALAEAARHSALLALPAFVQS